MEKDPININYNGINIKKIFTEAYNYYDQKIGGKGNIYISKKSVNGLHIAVLPNRNTYVFSEYNLGNDEDVEKLQQYKDKNVHKTYLCSLCPILEEDNAVILTDEQNQLYLDKNDTPALTIRYTLKGNSGKNYTITGTVPQYYYSHLLWSTEDHIPTYGLFLSKDIFSDLLLFLRHCTQTEPKTKAFFNGTFGSDIYHCHVHLSNQDTDILEKAYDSFYHNYDPTREVYSYNSDIVKLIVVTSPDIDKLYPHVSGICTEYIKTKDTDPSTALTANLAYTRDRYWITLQLVDKTRATWVYNNCSFYTIPASFIMISDCMKVPKNKTEYDDFQKAQLTHYSNYYLIWDITNYYRNFYGKFNDYLNIIKQTPFNQYSLVNPVEFLWIKFNLQEIQINIQEAIDILNYIGSDCISEGNICDNHNMGKYKYLIGLAVNNLPIDILNTQFSELRINAIFYFLRDYIYRGVKSDYLFFRGVFAQQLLVKTFNNFLKITGTSSGVNLPLRESDGNLPLTESDGVNNWINYNFKRIGEPSGMAAGATLSELKPYSYRYSINDKVDVEFFVKIMLEHEHKQSNFLREFFASMSVNDIRNLVPNYMLCYGGFMCHGDAPEKLCNNIAGQKFSYLLLENIKNSETVDRVLKLPSLESKDDTQDIVDMIYQIVAGLCVGWETNKFTHYDLHLDNIMRYDFVSNKDYLKLFKIYEEKKGDAIPKIEKIFFKYYTDPNDSNTVFYVPVKYLYVIIDYGFTYTNDMPATSLTPISWLDNNDFNSKKSNSYFDIYTMIMFLMFRVMTSKPYLIFDKDGNWLQNNILVDLFGSFLTNFAQLFITDTKQVMEVFSQLQKRNPNNRHNAFKETYLGLLKHEHNSGYVYFLRNFDESSVGKDFSSSWKLLNFMHQRYYENIDFESLEKQDDVYIFNWGYTPENIIRGIEANSQIKDMIYKKDQLKKQKISEVRTFVNTKYN